MPRTEPSFSEGTWKRFQSEENAPVPFLILDAGGTIQHITHAARRVLDYASRDELDSYFFTHVHGRNLRRVMQDLAQIVQRRKQRASWLLRLRTGTGRWRWFRAVASQRPDGEDGVVVRLRRT